MLKVFLFFVTFVRNLTFDKRSFKIVSHVLKHPTESNLFIDPKHQSRDATVHAAIQLRWSVISGY